MTLITLRKHLGYVKIICMKYKMIASDYDGTIYPFDAKEVPLYTKKMIHRYIEKGGKFILSTGRIFSSIKKEAERLGLSGELICLQGSAIYSLDSGELLFEESMDTDIAAEVLRYGESEGRVCQAYFGKDYYTQKENDFTCYYSKYCNVLPVYTGIKLSEYVKINKIRPFKIIIITEPAESVKALKNIKEYFGDSVDVSQSGPMYVEIVSAKSGKGNAVKKIASHYGIDMDNVAVFGDALNDISMLKVAGLSVAVDNAMNEVKAVASLITDSAEDSGVAKVIEKILNDEID